MNAVALQAYSREYDASLYGAIVRSLTSLTRPLATAVPSAIMLLKLKLKWNLKQVAVLGMKKVYLTVQTAIANPTKFFTRPAVSTLHAFQHHPRGMWHVVCKEFRVRGVTGIVRKAIGPYLYNSFAALAMFQTYTKTRLVFHGLCTVGDRPCNFPLFCEAGAGVAAGFVQATLNTPLYNIKLRRVRGLREAAVKSEPPPPPRGILASVVAMHGRVGLAGVYRSFPYVFTQESCSLAAFFTSYEWFKSLGTQVVREHIDPSGEKDMIAWAAAASAAGVILAAVGTPFENVLEWHVTRRSPGAPHGVLLHFAQDARRKTEFRGVLRLGGRI